MGKEQGPPRIFYGWVMVALAFITGVVGVGQNYLNGILIVSLRERFEISQGHRIRRRRK
jgi:hypothetical protein